MRGVSARDRRVLSHLDRVWRTYNALASDAYRKQVWGGAADVTITPHDLQHLRRLCLVAYRTRGGAGQWALTEEGARFVAENPLEPPIKKLQDKACDYCGWEYIGAVRKCIVKDCPNTSDHGKFFGPLCSPCASALQGIPCQGFMMTRIIGSLRGSVGE